MFEEKPISLTLRKAVSQSKTAQSINVALQAFSPIESKEEENKFESSRFTSKIDSSSISKFDNRSVKSSNMHRNKKEPQKSKFYSIKVLDDEMSDEVSEGGPKEKKESTLIDIESIGS